MLGIFVISAMCILSRLALAGPTSTLPSLSGRKFRDSQVSHIKMLPSTFIHTEDDAMAAADATIKNYHTEKFLNKNHVHKMAIDNKKKKKNGLTNHEILKSMGFGKMKTLPGHHRKRLAVDSSRHNLRPDDSHMFVVKLPPNPYYYTNTNTGHSKNAIEDGNTKVSSMGFKLNGKPGRIYHWNLPVLKKILRQKNDKTRKSSNLRSTNDAIDLIDIKSIPTWSNPWDENDTLEKAFGKHDAIHAGDDLTKTYKKKTPTYYAPAKQKSDATKYFPGNGKPKSFYVIKKNQHKPFYQKFIP